jgi:hypothetical protein
MRIQVLLVAFALMWTSRVFAFGVDVGPVHIHGTHVKVGDQTDLKIVVDKITVDEDDKERVRKLEAHRKGDEDDKFKIKVVWADLDDTSKDVLKKAKEDVTYKMRIEKMDDDWKLVKIRANDDD